MIHSPSPSPSSSSPLQLSRLENVRLLDCSVLLQGKCFPHFRVCHLEENLFIHPNEIDLVIALTHIWETKSEPDPVNAQFQDFKEYVNKTYESEKKIGVFYDYSSLPQKDKEGHFVELPGLPADQQKKMLALGLSDMLDIYSGYAGKRTVVFSAHNSKQSLGRTWPLFEMFCASFFDTLSCPTFSVSLVNLANQLGGVYCSKTLTSEEMEAAYEFQAHYTSFRMKRFFQRFKTLFDARNDGITWRRYIDIVEIDEDDVIELREIIEDLLIHGLIVQLSYARITCNSDLDNIVEQVKRKKGVILEHFFNSHTTKKQEFLQTRKHQLSLATTTFDSWEQLKEESRITKIRRAEKGKMPSTQTISTNDFHCRVYV